MTSSHATIQLSPHSTHFSDDNLESLGQEHGIHGHGSGQGFHYGDPPRRPSFSRDKGSRGKGAAGDRCRLGRGTMHGTGMGMRTGARA